MTKPSGSSSSSRRRLRTRIIHNAMTSQQRHRRRLVEYTHCEYRQRHCEGPTEHNVVSVFDSDGHEGTDNNQTTPTTLAPTISNDEPSTPVPVEEEEEAASSSCVADEFGNYGSDGSDPDTVLKLVAFDYQVQTPREYTVLDLNGGLLAIVEKRLSQFVAEALLDICRSANTNDATDKNNNSNSTSSSTTTTATTKTTTTTSQATTFHNIFDRLLQAEENDDDDDDDEQEQEQQKDSLLTGLQVLPPEIVRRGREGVQCQTPLVEGADRCFTIRGAYTLVGQGGNSLDWALQPAIDVTRLTMNQGKLNDAHEGIVDVTFLGQISDEDYRAEFEDPSTLPPPIVSSSPRGSDNTKLENWHWILVGFGAALLLLIVTAVVSRRRRSRQDEREYDVPATTTIEQDEGRSDDSASRLIDSTNPPTTTTSRMAVLAAANEEEEEDEAKESITPDEQSEAVKNDIMSVEDSAESDEAKRDTLDTEAESGQSSDAPYEYSEIDSSDEAIYEGGGFRHLV